jgi:aspartyl-tRNA(Asn)/glutamyl-tRNA(Gln) amidotransferase subunit A
MTADILFASLADLGKLLKARKVSSKELTAAYVDRLEKLGPEYNAIATVTRGLAKQQAMQADLAFQRHHIASPLQGIPFGVKDLLATKGIPTTWGAEPFRDQVFDYDATVIRQLRASGAVLAAKLAMVPLAGGGGYRYSATHLFGTCKNPWNPAHWAGGSSSGPAAAVSAAMVPFAIGSETGGSIVVAAAYSGISAIRPTYGLVSRHGAMALSWTLDKLGPMCHSADDCALVLASLTGEDPQDPSCSGRIFRAERNGPPLNTIRAGFWPADFTEAAVESARPAFTAAIEELRHMGLLMKEVKLPVLPYREVSGVIARGELATVMESLIRDETRLNQLRDERQKAGLKAGLALPATQYLQATRVRRLIQEQIRDFFTQVDVLVCFTERNPAPRIDSEPPDRPGARGPGRTQGQPPSGNTDLMAASNLNGLPGITLPCGFSTGTNLPLGLHLVGHPFEEALLIHIGREYQKRTDWHLRRPPVPA